MEQELNKKLLYIISIVASLLCIIMMIIIVQSNLFIANTTLLWILGFIYLSIIIYYFIKLLIIYKRKKIKLRKYIISGVILTIIAFLLLPIKFQNIVSSNIIEKNILQNNRIYIEAIGEKNTKSAGYKICIEGIKLNGNDYNLYEIKLIKPWKFIDARPTLNTKANSKIEINFNKNSKYRLIFRRQKDAGKVRIIIGKYKYTYDLYSSRFNQKYELDLSKLFLKHFEFDKLHMYIFNIIYLIILYIIINVVLLIYLSTNIKKAKHFKKL